jgi:hypothetical protein
MEQGEQRDDARQTGQERKEKKRKEKLPSTWFNSNEYLACLDLLQWNIYNVKNILRRTTPQRPASPDLCSRASAGSMPVREYNIKMRQMGNRNTSTGGQLRIRFRDYE